MKIKSVILLLSCVVTVTACTNKKKQTLRDNQQEKAKLEELYVFEETLDTIIPHPGIKYAEKRDIDPQNPPVTINLDNPEKNKELDVSRFYSQVEYVKVKHPLSEQGVAFLGNSEYEVIYPQGAMMGSGANSRVFLMEDKLIVGDNFFGYYCFDGAGNFLYTLAVKKDLPEFNVKNNRAIMHLTPESETISGISVCDDNCIIGKISGKKGRLFFHNTSTQKNYLSRPASMGTPLLLSPDTYVAYLYHPVHSRCEPFLYAFDIKGDTLSRWVNYNPSAEIGKGVYTNPESSIFYRYGKQLTIRQAYNDTIFRLSADKMIPAFVLNLGSKKPDMQTALKGDKKGKLFIEKLLETDDFLLIVYSENYDSPNNRKSGAVTFFYSYYDKKAGKCRSIPSNQFPERFTLKNGIEGAIPLMLCNAAVYKDQLYASYTKNQLKELIDSETFTSFPITQQEKVWALYNETTEYDMIIMMLK